MGVRPVRELLGVVSREKADHGVVVTSGTFTRQAQNFAEGSQITLIDGAELVSLIGDLHDSVRTVDTPATRDPQLPAAPASAPRPTAPTCPRCGSQMDLKTATKGPSPGSKFWGCPNFPRCRGTRPI